MLHDNEIYISINCSNDSDCLSNKCFNNYCIFNEKNPIVNCDDIYTGNRKSYMYCGKPADDICKNNLKNVMMDFVVFNIMVLLIAKVLQKL